MNSKGKSGLELLVDGSQGIYVPQAFAENFRMSEWGVPEAREVLKAGPDHKDYWEVWESVLANARYTDLFEGNVYQLYQDEDLWAVCLPLLTEKERAGFFEEPQEKVWDCPDYDNAKILSNTTFYPGE